MKSKKSFRYEANRKELICSHYGFVVEYDEIYDRCKQCGHMWVRL